VNPTIVGALTFALTFGAALAGVWLRGRLPQHYLDGESKDTITITFTSYGLFAPRNPMVISVLFLCAVSVGSALFLVLEMDGPFTGVLRVSPDLLLSALAHLKQ
jgi:hypothetical protein